jgi:hypothetical protein
MSTLDQIRARAVDAADRPCPATDCQDDGCLAEQDRAALLAAIDALLGVADRHDRIAVMLMDLNGAVGYPVGTQAENAAMRHRRSASTIRHKIDHAVTRENHV